MLDCRGAAEHPLALVFAMSLQTRGEISRRQFLAGSMVALLSLGLCNRIPPQVIGIGATGQRVVSRLPSLTRALVRTDSVLLVASLGDAYGSSHILSMARAISRSGRTVHLIADFPALFEARARCRAAMRCVGDLEAAGVALHVVHMERVLVELPRSASIHELRAAADARLASEVTRDEVGEQA